MQGDTVELAAARTGLDASVLTQIVQQIGGEGSLSEFANAIKNDPSSLMGILDKDGDGKIEGEDLAKLRNKGKGDDKKPEPKKQEESVDEHICPLCESVLEEELSDDQIFEHVNEILGALENLNEAADEEDEDVDEAMDDEQDPKEMKKKMKEKKKDDLDELASSAMDDRETGGDQKDALDKARDAEKGGKDEAMMNASKKSKKEAVMKKVKELKKSAKKA